MRANHLAFDGINWISTYGGRFIVLPDALLPDWRGYFDENADPLDTSHDYGRACATSGYTASLAVGTGQALVFGENKTGGVWFGRSLPILFEWVYADDEAAVIRALKDLPNDMAVDAAIDFEVFDNELVVFDSAFSGSDFEPQHSCRFSVKPGRYVITSTFYKPDDVTGLIIHRFLHT